MVTHIVGEILPGLLPQHLILRATSLVDEVFIFGRIKQVVPGAYPDSVYEGPRMSRRWAIRSSVSSFPGSSHLWCSQLDSYRHAGTPCPHVVFKPPICITLSRTSPTKALLHLSQTGMDKLSCLTVPIAQATSSVDGSVAPHEKDLRPYVLSYDRWC